MPGPKAPQEHRREQILDAAYQVALHTGIDGITIRAVAAAAGLSHGLVLFHFVRKDELVAALLDRVLATTAAIQPAQDVLRIDSAPDRLRALLRQELEHLAVTPHDRRIFFEYWALGTRHPGIRARIASALERYRSAFSAFASDALRADPTHRTLVTPDGFAAVAVSLVSGCAVQAMADPEAFDMGTYLDAVTGIIEQIVAPVDPTSREARA